MNTEQALLLQKELEYITGNRDKWNQWVWLEEAEAESDSACGTVGCLAGNAALHAGLVTKVHWESINQVNFNLDVNKAESQLGINIRRLDHEDQWILTGAALFGLTETEARILFFGENDLATLWRLAYKFSGGAITVPIEYQRW